MSEHVKQVEWFGRIIYLDEEYLVYFTDQPREMTNKEREEYDYISKAFPGKLKWMELAQMDPRKNPNVTPMKGWELIRLGEQGYIPQFDRFFAMEDLQREHEREKQAARAGGAKRLHAKDPSETRRLTMIPPEGTSVFLDWQADRDARSFR